MSKSWPTVPLSDVARPVTRPVSVRPGNSYRTIGVKWWGEGAYERQTIDGSQTAAKTLSLVRENDLIINKIWVRHGSTAIAGRDVDGCAASGEFPTFELDLLRALPRWLHWYTKTQAFWARCDDLSRGTSGKNRIKPERFLSIEVALPPLAEQQRVVARIEELTKRIHVAQALRQEADANYDRLCRAVLWSECDGPLALTPMRQLVKRIEPNVTVLPTETYHFAGVWCFGRGIFRGNLKTGVEFAYKRLTKIKMGQFVYPKLMAWEGALGVVPPECDGLFVSPEFPVFDVDQSKVLPETLDTYFRTPSVWPSLGGASTGTNVRRRRLNPEDFLRLEIPLPSMRSQLRLREVKATVGAAKTLLAQVATELDAMLPAVLDQAFKGEL